MLLLQRLLPLLFEPGAFADESRCCCAFNAPNALAARLFKYDVNSWHDRGPFTCSARSTACVNTSTDDETASRAAPLTTGCAPLLLPVRRLLLLLPLLWLLPPSPPPPPYSRLLLR